MRITILLLTFLFISCSVVTSQTVYKTPSGIKYHSSNCRWIENCTQKMDVCLAVQEYNLNPCNQCNPPIWNGGECISSNTPNEECFSQQCHGWAKSTNARCKSSTKNCNGYCSRHNPKNSNRVISGDTRSTDNRHGIISRPSAMQSSTCGAKNKTKGYCKRKVSGGGRCYQHR